jgi:signal transduction histidine kinase
MVAAGGSLMAGLVAAMLLSWRARRELAPLESLSEAVRQIDPGRPAPGMATTERSELEPIRGAINDLAARLARRLAGERAFSAHAAHALRTPLAGLDAQLAVCLLQADERLAPRLQRSRDAVARLRSVVQALLTFFRSGSEPHWQPLLLQVLGERLGVESLVLHWRGVPSVTADPDLLAAALMNLLDNAQRHGAHEVVVEAGSTPGLENFAEGGAVNRAGLPIVSFWVSVRDDGPGIPEPERERLQAELNRELEVGASPDFGSVVTPQGAAGSRLGLGLVLCDLVARAHGGRLHLISSDSGAHVRLEWNAPKTSL